MRPLVWLASKIVERKESRMWERFDVESVRRENEWLWKHCEKLADELADAKGVPR